MAPLKALFRDMLRNRRIEEEIARRYADQEMRCPVHLSIGQEAISAGVCLALEPTDQVVSTHRAHAHYLSKGGDLNRMLAEFHGKATGCCGGRGGSMHIFDHDVGMLLSLPIVASGIPIAVGAALAMRQTNTNGVAVAFVGDAAVEEGVFHEAANFAALRSLPIIFVCENNLFSVYTRLDDRQPDLPLQRLGAAHGIHAETADGNDASLVYNIMQNAVARARAPARPCFPSPGAAAGGLAGADEKRAPSPSNPLPLNIYLFLCFPGCAPHCHIHGLGKEQYGRALAGIVRSAVRAGRTGPCVGSNGLYQALWRL